MRDDELYERICPYPKEVRRVAIHPYEKYVRIYPDYYSGKDGCVEGDVRYTHHAEIYSRCVDCGELKWRRLVADKIPHCKRCAAKAAWKRRKK
jgi:hypothetical protein